MRVWFDELTIAPGKSQSRQMDVGLQKARAGVVLLTPAYVAGRFWTERELGALLGKETLIPVLHKVTFAEVKEYSGILPDLAGFETARDTVEVIAQKIAAAVLGDAGTPPHQRRLGRPSSPRRQRPASTSRSPGSVPAPGSAFQGQGIGRGRSGCTGLAAAREDLKHGPRQRIGERAFCFRLTSVVRAAGRAGIGGGRIDLCRLAQVPRFERALVYVISHGPRPSDCSDIDVLHAEGMRLGSLGRCQHLLRTLVGHAAVQTFERCDHPSRAVGATGSGHGDLHPRRLRAPRNLSVCLMHPEPKETTIRPWAAGSSSLSSSASLALLG